MTESRDGKLSEGGKAVKPPTYHPKSCFTFTTIQCTLLYNILCKLTNFTSALIKSRTKCLFSKRADKILRYGTILSNSGPFPEQQTNNENRPDLQLNSHRTNSRFPTIQSGGWKQTAVLVNGNTYTIDISEVSVN